MADDDIDDLLDEVESKFVNGKESEMKVQNNKAVRRKQEDAEIDQLIDDICVDSKLTKCNKVDFTPSITSQTSRPISARCFALCIGGSSVSIGHGNSVNRRSCSTIRCTSCDFKVISFDDFEWDPTTDYLFLRNNAPDFERLKSNLRKKKGYRAYCCQCSHIAVNMLTDVKDLQLKWVCGRH